MLPVNNIVSLHSTSQVCQNEGVMIRSHKEVEMDKENENKLWLKLLRWFVVSTLGKYT